MTTPTFTTTLAPKIAYLGHSFTIDIEPRDPNYEYRILVLKNGRYDYNTPFVSTNTFTVTPSQTGLSAIVAQVRSVSSKTIAMQNASGTYQVFDPAAAAAAVRETSRLAISTALSSVSAQASQASWRSGISSFRDLATYIDGQFQASNTAQTGLSGYSATTAKALYYMQWVSGLWGDGNVVNTAAGGSVQDNEATGHTDSANMTVRTYLDSPIGACTDFVTVLGFLLTNAGIPTRVIGTGTHVFNEAYLDGDWRTLDANFSVFYNQGWAQVSNPASSPTLVHFTSAGMVPGGRNYRPLEAAGYDQLLSLEASGYSANFTRFDTANYYANVVPYGQTFLNELNPTGLSSPSGSVVYLAQSQGLVQSGMWTTALADNWFVGDYDGDGKDDLLREIGGAGTQVLLSTGTSFQAPATWSAANTYLWYVGDFNGDGKSDILRYVSGYAGAEVFLSTGTSFTNVGSWTPAGDGSQGWYVGDFNGDGKDDIFSYLPGISGAQVFLSSGSGFVNNGSWTPVGNSGTWDVGDFNGDGKDDICFYNPEIAQIQVLTSSGTAFNAPAIWTQPGVAPNRILAVGDFNGDAMADIMTVGGTILYSTGSSFVASAAGDLGVGPQAWVTGDFDGDHRDDALYMPDTQGAIGVVANYSGLTSGQFTELVVQHLVRFTIGQVSSTVSDQAALTAWRSGITTFDGLYQYINNRFQAADAEQSGFAAIPSDFDQAVYLLQWVSGMWAYGNKVDTAHAGSVLQNENAGTTSPDAATASTYVNATIGNGADEATLLAYLLTSAGISNQIISASGYVFNQIRIGQETWTLNAATGSAYDTSFAGVTDTRSTPKVYEFDLGGTRAASSTYRQALAQLLHETTLSLADGLVEQGQTFNTAQWFASRPDALTFLGAMSLPGVTVGTTGNDSLASAAAGQVLAGGAGNDVIAAGGGGATLAGGSGNDALIRGTLATGFAQPTSWTSAKASSWFSGDFNGDGVDDVLRYVAGKSGANVLLSSASAFADAGSWTTDGSGSQGWYVGDFNGDGKSDVLSYVTGKSGAEAYLSTGSSFVDSGSWTPAGNGGRWYVGDFNGDGKTDVFRYVPGQSGANVFLSTGSGFANVGSWTVAGGGSQGWYVGDFNGDGKSDIMRYIAGTGEQVLLSNGTGFVGAGTWAKVAADKFYVGDFNGDGKDDLAFVPTGQTSEADVYLSTGSGFVNSGAWLSAAHLAPSITVGDFDGAPGADLLTSTATAAPTVALANGAPATAGADTFVFTPNFGHDTINEFQVSSDILQFDTGIFADLTAALAHTSQVGSDTLIKFDANNDLRLHDVNMANLTAGNFKLV